VRTFLRKSRGTDINGRHQRPVYVDTVHIIREKIKTIKNKEAV
jgi:hypothetical protein